MNRYGLRGVMMGVAAALVSGCVTINIYFPAAAAEKAADKIIDQVWRIPESPTPPPSDPSAAPPATKP